MITEDFGKKASSKKDLYYLLVNVITELTIF